MVFTATLWSSIDGAALNILSTIGLNVGLRPVLSTGKHRFWNENVLHFMVLG
jgi:hypothetical protein